MEIVELNPMMWIIWLDPQFIELKILIWNSDLNFTSVEVGLKLRSWCKVNLSNCRMASVISKMGFVFLEQGFPRMLIPICISISICCSGTGFYYQVLWSLGWTRILMLLCSWYFSVFAQSIIYCHIKNIMVKWNCLSLLLQKQKGGIKGSDYIFLSCSFLHVDTFLTHDSAFFSVFFYIWSYKYCMLGIGVSGCI